MKKKNKVKKVNPKMLFESSHNLSFGENQEDVEELLYTEKVTECFSKGEDDDKNVIDRVILF